MAQPGIVVVSRDTAPLSDTIAKTMRARGTPTQQIGPGALGDLQVSLGEEVFCVAGQPIGAILFWGLPGATFSNGFATDERPFCDAEVGATWLAASHLGSVLAINRYDSTPWFEEAGWPVWRRKLMDAGIPVSPFAFGNVAVGAESFWYPYAISLPQSAPDCATRALLGSAVTHSRQQQRALVVCSQVIAGAAQSAVLDTARLLNDAGVQVAEIATDDEGNILCVNTAPLVSEAESVRRATELLVGVYEAHLHRW